jgi:hypothetical protein
MEDKEDDGEDDSSAMGDWSRGSSASTSSRAPLHRAGSGKGGGGGAAIPSRLPTLEEASQEGKASTPSGLGPSPLGWPGSGSLFSTEGVEEEEEEEQSKDASSSDDDLVFEASASATRTTQTATGTTARTAPPGASSSSGPTTRTGSAPLSRPRHPLQTLFIQMEYCPRTLRDVLDGAAQLDEAARWQVGGPCVLSCAENTFFLLLG